MDNNVSCRERAVSLRCPKPFKKQASHEVQEYANGCCHAQKNVLLKGFAKIVKSKGCPRTAIKLFVFFICTSGFFYQTWEFLEMYLDYPTTLDTSEENPDSFMEPAITVCDRNRILRQPYCKTYPKECTWEHTTWESFCDSYRRMCPETKPPDFNFGIMSGRERPLAIAPIGRHVNNLFRAHDQLKMNHIIPTGCFELLKIPVYKRLRERNRSNAYLNAVGPQEDSNLIDDCMPFGRSYIPLCNTTPTVIQVLRVGLPYRCFSLSSLLLKPYEEPSNLTVIDGYVLQLNMHPEEHFDTIDLVQASIVFHDPRKAVNPMTEGLTLTAGNVYHLFPTMERRESLPPPYTSNCVDYLKEWKKNGGSGPLSRDDCMDQCKIKAMLDEYGCVAHTMSYPNKFPICSYINFYVSPEDTRKCASSCRDACEENIYHVTSDTVLDYHGSCNATDEYCKSQYLHIKVSFNRMKIKKFKQIPRIESIELFSYIGGYLGMWLGISLAAVFDLGEMLYDVIDSAFKKRKRNLKATTPIEQVGHHTAANKY